MLRCMVLVMTPHSIADLDRLNNDRVSLRSAPGSSAVLTPSPHKLQLFVRPHLALVRRHVFWFELN